MKTKTYLPRLCLLALIALLSGCGNATIQSVRDATLDLDPAVTVGDALDRYKFFDRVEWRQIQDDQRRTIVEFRGRIDPARYANVGLPEMGTITPAAVAKFQQATKGLTVHYVSRFTVAKDGQSFEVTYSGLHVGGKHPKTGETISDDLPDKDLTTLRLIYKGLPDSMTMGLILGAQ